MSLVLVLRMHRCIDLWPVKNIACGSFADAPHLAVHPDGVHSQCHSVEYGTRIEQIGLFTGLRTQHARVLESMMAIAC